MELTDCTAAVTGAAHGIGLALCRALVARGVNVVGIDRNEDGVTRALAGLGAPDRVLALAADVADEAALELARDRAEQRFGAVDLICNNAGVGGMLGPAWELPADEWERVLDVNLRGVVHGIRTFVPAMVERGRGHIVNTASMAGILPMPYGAPYTASKHAVVGMSSALRLEVQRSAPGVGVSVLCPGWTDTGIVTSADAGVLSGHADGPAGAMARHVGKEVQQGTSPDAVARAVLAAVEADEFWIVTHPDQAAAIAPYWAEASAAARPA